MRRRGRAAEAMARRASRQRSRRDGGGRRQPPWRRLVNPYRPLEILSSDEVEAIHRESLRILEELGIEFLHDGALDLLAKAGARVDRSSKLVRFDRFMIEEVVGRAPGRFTLASRAPERSIEVGGPAINFASVGGPPNCADLERGRRPGTHADFLDVVRLIHSLDAIHLCGGAPLVPIDLPAETRHLDCYHAFITLTDRVWHATGLGRVRVDDAIAMQCLARGIDREALAREPGLFTIINANSPRRFDGPMLEGLIEMARHGQAVVVTPFTLSGAMAPVTIEGALTLQNAEALAGIALAQLVRPGTPVVYGGFTSNVDMRTGAPAFGTPEYAKACLAAGQLARRYRLPYRSSNVNAANLVDAQAAYESQMSLWGAVMGHANLVHHAAGWLEGGLTVSFEKLVIDAEMLQMMAELLRPLEVTPDRLAFAAIAEVPPGGHFFGADHTLARYETAFYTPLVSDWRNYETWREAGGLSATERAHRIWKELLREYQPPPLDPAIGDALSDYVARRRREPIAA
jgi:trimethylamine--corrinoid protein Co-methyltransferase